MSEHFTLPEYLASDTAKSIGVSNFPSWEVVENLAKLSEVMEKVRAAIGDTPITLTSGFCSYEVNLAVGGAPNSAHLYGLACDFVAPGFGTPLDICLAIESYVYPWGIDQLIHEIDWVHLGLRTEEARCECFTIYPNGAYKSGF